MGVFADKDYRSVIEKTAHFADQILTIQTPDNVRALPAEELAQEVAALTGQARAFSTVEEAVDAAVKLLREDMALFCCGSLYLAAQIRPVLQERLRKRQESACH